MNLFFLSYSPPFGFFLRKIMSESTHAIFGPYEGTVPTVVLSIYRMIKGLTQHQDVNRMQHPIELVAQLDQLSRQCSGRVKEMSERLEHIELTPSCSSSSITWRLWRNETSGWHCQGGIKGRHRERLLNGFHPPSSAGLFKSFAKLSFLQS